MDSVTLGFATWENLANTVGVNLVRLNCFILLSELGGTTKTALRPLEAQVRAELNLP